MSVNPYESPATQSAAVPPDIGYRLDGRQLVVRSGVVLPQVCVKTNQPVTTADIKQRNLSFCPPVVGLLILLSGLLLILVYFIVRKSCLITFGLSPDVRRKYRNRRIIKIVATVTLFLALPFAAGMDSTPVIIGVFGLFLVAIVSLFVGSSPLTITKHRQGEFWISGCSPEFLAGISPGEATRR